MNKVRAMGTELIKKKAGAETEDWKVGSLTSIGEVGLEVGEIDVTTLDSPEGAKEFIPGDKEAGELSIAGIIKKDTDEKTVSKMMALLHAGSVESWNIVFPSGAKWELTGFIKSFKTGEVTTDGFVNFTGAIRISGNPVYVESKTV